MVANRFRGRVLCAAIGLAALGGSRAAVQEPTFKGGNDLASTFAHVADELHRQYALGFTPMTLDGKMHTLEVRVAGLVMMARARRSYLARSER
jgi:hypothetical protein